MNTDDFKYKLTSIREKIESACAKVGRDPSSCRIMAVTKTHPVEIVRIAIESGQILFGENRIKEAQEKFTGLATPCELHLIGHLQRNKVSIAAELFSCVQSIDKPETMDALNVACSKSGKRIDFLIEVNTSGEESKFGVTGTDQYEELIENLGRFEHIRFRGLMTVGPLTDDEKRIRASFVSLRHLFDDTKKNYPHLQCDILSMGMSSDYEIAVEEGSTLLRIGTALFGKRE
jgi:pyridoxal phosphate enzyme (YggS family)